MFSIAFMVVVFVLGNPETQTVSHSFPKVCAALQRKFGTDAAYRAGRRYVFGLASRERMITNGSVLASAPAMPQRSCVSRCNATLRLERGGYCREPVSVQARRNKSRHAVRRDG